MISMKPLNFVFVQWKQRSGQTDKQYDYSLRLLTYLYTVVKHMFHCQLKRIDRYWWQHNSLLL